VILPPQAPSIVRRPRACERDLATTESQGDKHMGGCPILKGVTKVPRTRAEVRDIPSESAVGKRQAEKGQR